MGSPESAGFFQYVCQPSDIRRRSPSCSGWPGWMEVVSETRLACTFLLPARSGLPIAASATRIPAVRLSISIISP